MIRIGICDDNALIAEKLEALIIRYGEEHNIDVETYVYHDGSEVLEDRIQFDILFLDVEMPETDGIDTAKQIRKWDARVKIIFITSYTHYMRNAFAVHAFEYLVKPFNTAKVNMVLTEVFDFIEKENKSHDISLVMGGELKVFASNDIYYFERVRRKIKMSTTQGDFEFSGVLSEIMEKVKDFDFEYCHKSVIVNLFHCKRMRAPTCIWTMAKPCPSPRNGPWNLRRGCLIILRRILSCCRGLARRISLGEEYG